VKRPTKPTREARYRALADAVHELGIARTAAALRRDAARVASIETALTQLEPLLTEARANACKAVAP
jgi:hypothetical protein